MKEWLRHTFGLQKTTVLGVKHSERQMKQDILIRQF